ncbi:hypothetical protein TSO5_15120 [Azospirillum sp. TSO5]|nr:hypothetical protein TSO5_15120 [Azospirillum sp. TSO5]
MVVKRVDYSAIEGMGGSPYGAPVLRQRRACHFIDSDQTIIGGLQKIERSARHQVQTIAEMDDGTDDECLTWTVTVECPFVAPPRVGFPEIYPRSEPVPFVLTVQQMGDPSSENILTN